MKGNQKPSTSSDVMAQFVPIAPRSEEAREPGLARKYSGPDFLSTIVAMRTKLLELQNASVGEEPTKDQEVLKRWKNSNQLIYGGSNDLRRYEHISTLSNKNFSMVLEIAANAQRCSRSGKISQYTFKSLKKCMTEEEVYNLLTQILEGDHQTVSKLNKTTSKKVRSETEVQVEEEMQTTTEDENWKEQFQREQRKNVDLSKEIEELRTRLSKCEEEKTEAQRERDRFKGKCQELLKRVKETEAVIDELKSREIEDRSRRTREISRLQEELSSTTTMMSEALLKDVDEELGASVEAQQRKKRKLDISRDHSEVHATTKTEATEKKIGILTERKTEVKTSSGRTLLLTTKYQPSSSVGDIVPPSPAEHEIRNSTIAIPTEYYDIEESVVKQEFQPEEEELIPLVTSTPIKEENEILQAAECSHDDFDQVDYQDIERTNLKQREQDVTDLRMDVGDVAKPTAIGEFVAVAYSNCDKFYLGKVVRLEGNIMMISFLEASDRRDDRYKWPSQEKVEPAEPEQVFMTGLKTTQEGKHLSFPHLQEVKQRFPGIHEELLYKQKREQVDSIWNDLEIPFRNFPSGVIWKDLKTIQLDMPDFHESFMLSLFGKNVLWKRGWLNDEVINRYMNFLEKTANKKGKNVITANCFFFERVEQKKSWRAKTNLAAHKKFLFPGQFGQRNHWVLGVVDLEKNTISEVDPAGGKNSNFVKVIRNFLESRKGMEGRTWREVDVSHPIQTDDVSCGVYVLKIAECIIEDREIAFDQNDIDNYRYEVAFRLLGL